MICSHSKLNNLGLIPDDWNITKSYLLASKTLCSTCKHDSQFLKHDFTSLKKGDL